MSIKKIVTSAGETKWEVRVYENGRGSKRVTRRFDRKNEAEGFLQDFKEEQKKQERDGFEGVPIRERLFRDEADHWLTDGKLRFTESHQKRVMGVLREIMPEYGDLSVARFTPDLLSRYQQGEKAKGLSNNTINRKTEVIQAVLNFSLRQRRIPYNPSAGFRKLRSDQSEADFWTRDEALSFLNAMNKRHPKNSSTRWVYVVYLLALNTGVRAGEIWGLKAMDLITHDSTLWVRRQFSRVTNAFGPTKGKKARHVPCSNELASELEALLRSGKHTSEQTIFKNEEGNPICHENFVKRQFAPDLKAWGGKRARFHDLRHTATTLMIASGVDIKTVKEICGHKDVQTAMNYVHLVSGSVGRVAKMYSLERTKMEEVLEPTKLKLV